MKNNQMPQGMPQFSPGQLDSLLQMASTKLGVPADALKRQLQNGQLPSGIDASNISQMLNDPKKLEMLLNSKAAQQFLQGMMNGKK